MKKVLSFASISIITLTLSSCGVMIEMISDDLFGSREDRQRERRAKQYERDGKSPREASRHAFYDSVGHRTGD
ncbi:MAG: hypothetical protein ACSHYB_08300 [Roseibacillus sp.]